MNDNLFYPFIFQDSVLTNNVRKLSGVPLLYLYCKTVTLEEPQGVSIRAAEDKLKHKINPSEYQLQEIKRLKVEAFGETEEEERRWKKKTGNPNPLSCKTKSKDRKKKKKMKKNRKPKMTLDSVLQSLNSSSS